MLKHIRQDTFNRRRYPCCCTSPWCDLTWNPFNHISEMISSNDAENWNDDHWSNGEHILQGKTKRGQFVWPSKMQAERRKAISRTILAQDQMGITQPRIEFSLEVWHRLQCFSPTRVKARSYKTKPGPFARSPQENLGTGSERTLTSWASVAHLHAPGFGLTAKPHHELRSSAGSKMCCPHHFQQTRSMSVVPPWLYKQCL